VANAARHFLRLGDFQGQGDLKVVNHPNRKKSAVSQYQGMMSDVIGDVVKGSITPQAANAIANAGSEARRKRKEDIEATAKVMVAEVHKKFLDIIYAPGDLPSREEAERRLREWKRPT
jgi:hypothetical protein